VHGIKKDDDYASLIPVEVKVAFDSEIKSKLFLNKGGTIVCPEETEAIVSVSEAVNTGYKVEWNGEELTMSKGGLQLPVKVKNGTPILPNEICLELIEEIERAKMTQLKTEKKNKDEVELESIWPQLKNALAWMLKDQVEGATELMKMIMCKRRNEIRKEETSENSPEEEKKDVKENILEVEAVENPNP
jgi:hypothetical protein